MCNVSVSPGDILILSNVNNESYVSLEAFKAHVEKHLDRIYGTDRMPVLYAAFHGDVKAQVINTYGRHNDPFTDYDDSEDDGVASGDEEDV